MKRCSPHSQFVAQIKGFSLACVGSLSLYGCQLQLTDNPVLWGLKFLSARQTHPGPLPAQLPRPLKPAIPAAEAPPYRISHELASVDVHGLRRLQLWVTTTGPQTHFKYIYRDLVAQYHTTHDVLWVNLSAQGRPQSQGEWFSPLTAPYQRYSITRPQERYAGVQIEYRR